eukprot:7881796-Karenia_brevis.AAC.1
MAGAQLLRQMSSIVEGRRTASSSVLGALPVQGISCVPDSSRWAVSCEELKAERGRCCMEEINFLSSSCHPPNARPW